MSAHRFLWAWELDQEVWVHLIDSGLLFCFPVLSRWVCSEHLPCTLICSSCIKIDFALALRSLQCIQFRKYSLSTLQPKGQGCAFVGQWRRGAFWWGTREVRGMSPETCQVYSMGLNQAQRGEEEGVLQKQRERMKIEKEVRADGVSTWKGSCGVCVLFM